MGIEEISGVDPFDGGVDGVRISNVLLSMPAHHHNRSLPGAFYLREGGPWLHTGGKHTFRDDEGGAGS